MTTSPRALKRRISNVTKAHGPGETHLARAVSEATLICVQAVTTVDIVSVPDIIRNVKKLTRTENKGSTIDQEDSRVSGLRLGGGQENNVSL